MKTGKISSLTFYKIATYIIIQFLICSPCSILYAQSRAEIEKNTLSPKAMIGSPMLKDLIGSALNAEEQAELFKLPENAKPEVSGGVTRLNALSAKMNEQEFIEAVLSDPELEGFVSRMIRAQDRMEDLGGLSVDRAWAEKFKNQALAKAVEGLGQRDIFFLQMEYELSTHFLIAFKNHLMDKYLRKDGSMSKEEAEKLAVYGTGQLAKLQMAGGLGSFKPDWVRGFYENLVQFWGKDMTKKKLHVMGIFYAKTIKGEGDLVRDKKLYPITEKIRQVKNISNNVQQRIEGQSELVDVALETMQEVVTYDIPVDMNGFETVQVKVYSNPYSDLHEYWMYCPEIFHEAYPGTANDEFRTVQTFVYREVLMRYMHYLVREGKIGKDIIISDSETSTALANPQSVDKNLESYPAEKREYYARIFKRLEEFDILDHHYNHTIVPDGMGTFPAWKFNELKINKELSFIQQGQKLDLRMLVGETHDILSGCSTAHTQIMRDHPDLYKYFSHKIREDDLFGNSEGSDVKRWQGKEIQMIVEIFMEALKVDSYDALFAALESDPAKKQEFINQVKVAKKMQKKRFINELFKGTFGKLDVTKEEMEKTGINLLECPLFTFVRRMVPYKCSNFILDILEDEAAKERFIKSGAVIIIGGRKFDGFAELQHKRIQELIKKDPVLKTRILFVSNHNVATSWIMQQGTDFGGMLSWEGMEAGPTSPSNAGLNWTNLFSTPDGVMIERLRKIKRDKNGAVIAGTGHIVEYGDERAGNALKSRLPDKESFLREMEQGCANYFNGTDYDSVAFYNMWLQMTQGDIRTQAAGTIRMWADYLAEKKAEKEKIKQAIDQFVQAQSEKSAKQILYEGHKFWFGEGWPQKESAGPGLAAFLNALKTNTAKGYVYNTTIDFVDYLKAAVKHKTLNKTIVNIFEKINGTPRNFSALTYYEKQKEMIEVIELLVSRLESGIDLMPDTVIDSNLVNIKNIESAI